MLSKDELEAYSKKYYPMVFKYCYSRLSNKQDAEDAAQEAFVVFSKKGHMLEADHVQCWLLTTAHYMVLKEYQRRSRIKEKESPYTEQLAELSGKVSRFQDQLVSFYMDKFVDDIYNRLSDREKELFDLYSDGSLKSYEIAQMLGLDVHACAMRKKRLKDKCKDIMVDILFF